MKYLYLNFLLVLLVLLSPITWARYMSSEWLKVTEVRSVVDSNVYFNVDRASICNTTVYKLKLATHQPDKTYSLLMAAALAGKEVKLETWGECEANGGWGTEIQGINIKVN